MLAGTLLHVAEVTSYDNPPERDDFSQLAELAMATGGMAISAGRPPGGIDATLLVKPIAIDNVEMIAPGWDMFDDCESRLPAGRACVWWAEGESITGPVAIEGMIWGKRISRVVQPDPSLATLLARELSVSHHHRRFSSDVRSEIDFAARAVNSRWSLFGSWGGRGGYRDRQVGQIGGLSSRSTSSSGHTMGFGTAKPAPTTTIDLTPQLRGAVAACRANRPVTARIETTLSEIVDVKVELLGAALDDAARARVTTCIEDAIWATHVTVPEHFPRGVSSARF